jgi:hypothetical protein
MMHLVVELRRDEDSENRRGEKGELSNVDREEWVWSGVPGLWGIWNLAVVRRAETPDGGEGGFYKRASYWLMVAVEVDEKWNWRIVGGA